MSREDPIIHGGDADDSSDDDAEQRGNAAKTQSNAKKKKDDDYEDDDESTKNASEDEDEDPNDVPFSQVHTDARMKHSVSTAGHHEKSLMVIANLSISDEATYQGMEANGMPRFSIKKGEYSMAGKAAPFDAASTNPVVGQKWKIIGDGKWQTTFVPQTSDADAGSASAAAPAPAAAAPAPAAAQASAAEEAPPTNAKKSKKGMEDCDVCGERCFDPVRNVCTCCAYSRNMRPPASNRKLKGSRPKATSASASEMAMMQKALEDSGRS